MLKTTTDTFQASEQQEAIFKLISEREVKSLVIEACPGSGKTTTSRMLMRYIPASANVLTLAFNVKAADELGKAVEKEKAILRKEGLPAPTATSFNIHKLGTETLRNHNKGHKKVQESTKYRNIAKSLLSGNKLRNDKEFIDALVSIVKYARLTLSGLYVITAEKRIDVEDNEEELKNIVRRFGIDINLVGEQWQFAKRVLKDMLIEGIAQAQGFERLFDFTDQIFLPVAFNYLPTVRYDYVLIDECQDLSPCQLSLILNSLKPEGYFVAVGDRHQAIYGFAGAGLRSIDEIIERTGAHTLPLSVCYRCPQDVVTLANSYYPGISAAPGAPRGKLDHILNDQIPTMIQPGDLVLSRTTAPLISLCLDLLRDGRKACVQGKDLGSIFTGLIDKITERTKYTADLFSSLREYAKEYKQKELSRLGDDDEMKADTLLDKLDTLNALFDAYMSYFIDEHLAFSEYVYTPETYDLEKREEIYAPKNRGRKQLAPSHEGFLEAIRFFFYPDPDATIILSTGHRAKGLEFPRVFILNFDKCPHPKAKSEDELVQEFNLLYVMITRSKFYGSDQNTGHLYLCYSKMEEEEEDTVVESSLVRVESVSEVVITPLAIAAPVSTEPATIEAIVEQPVTAAPISTEPSTTTPEPIIAAQTTGQTRNRVKWQGTYDPEVLANIQAMAKAINKENPRALKVSASQLFEELALESPRFQAYLESLKSEEPEPDPDGGGAPLPTESAPTESKIVMTITEFATTDQVASVQELGLAAYPELARAAKHLGVTIPPTQPEASEDAPAQEQVSLPEPVEERTPAASERLVRIFYKCRSRRADRKECGHAWAVDYKRREDATLYRINQETGEIIEYKDDRRAGCPVCQKKYQKTTQLTNITITAGKCNHICRNATSGEKCKCSCGGKNHGINHLTGMPLLK